MSNIPTEVIFNDVVLNRGDTTVLDNLSLQMSEQRIGLIGRNGSGKSSLVSLFNGLLSPTSGQILINGSDITAQKDSDRFNVGYIFQNPDHQIIFPTVIEEIAFSLEMSGVDRKTAKVNAEEYLKSSGFDDWSQRPVHMLSEGEKQWLCVHAVLITKPKILVLDEPFSSLDLVNRFRLMRWLSTFSQQIFLISHDLDSLSDFDRIIWLENGGVRADGQPSDVLPMYREDALTAADNDE